MTTTSRATPIDRLFGTQPDPTPTAPPDDPAVLEAAGALGIPTREIQGVREHPQGVIVDTAGISYIVLRDDQVDALGQAGVLVYDPDGTAPTLAMMGRYMSAKELGSGPWSGTSFHEVAAEALGVYCPLGEFRHGEQVIAWVDGDPVKASAFWATSARAADEPASVHAHRNPMAGWARALIVKAGILDVP